MRDGIASKYLLSIDQVAPQGWFPPVKVFVVLALESRVVPGFF
jgi:hypothetical protein